MAHYDRERGYRRGFGMRGGYGSEYGDWGDAWGAYPHARLRSRGPGPGHGWGPQAGGYGRDLYGADYPGYGGYPGGRQRGVHYGGVGYGRDYGRDYGWSERAWGPAAGREGAGGYDAGYVREPFMPEEVYRRHPEMNRPSRHLQGQWPDSGYDLRADAELDDGEIRQAVRQALFQDSWLDAEGIQVVVREGVVTLSGEVGDYMEARYAWDDAWESPGVRGVINHLTVRTDQPTEPHGDPLPQSEGRRGGGEVAAQEG